jgi:hypothetical protein
MRNWLSFPTVGMKGEPAAACQTSWSDESMCWDWLVESGLRIGADGSVEGRRKERRELVMMVCNGPRKCQLDSFPLQLVHSCLAKTGGQLVAQDGPGSALQQPGGGASGPTSLRIHLHPPTRLRTPRRAPRTSSITASPRAIKMKDESKSFVSHAFFLCVLTR